jgi:hypothetical protein
MPYTYFYIEEESKEGNIKIVHLTEICQPSKDFKNIGFWVDDNPEYNVDVIE